MSLAYRSVAQWSKIQKTRTEVIQLMSQNGSFLIIKQMYIQCLIITDFIIEKKIIIVGDISEIRMAYKNLFAIFSVIVKCIYSEIVLYEVYIKICSLLSRFVNICPNSSSVEGFTYIAI